MTLSSFLVLVVTPAFKAGANKNNGCSSAGVQSVPTNAIVNIANPTPATADNRFKKINR